MTLSTFASGVNTSFSTQLNNNFKSVGKILQLYTGTAFDSSVSGATQSLTSTYEMTAVTAAELASADYLFIEIFGKGATKSFVDQDATTSIKIEIKETGGAYSTAYDDTFMSNITGAGGGGAPVSTHLLRWVHTLTAGQKANGVQVKISSTSSTGADAQNTASFTNKQTILRTGF